MKTFKTFVREMKLDDFKNDYSKIEDRRGDRKVRVRAGDRWASSKPGSNGTITQDDADRMNKELETGTYKGGSPFPDGWRNETEVATNEKLPKNLPKKTPTSTRKANFPKPAPKVDMPKPKMETEPRTRVAEKPKTEPRDSMAPPRTRVAEKPKTEPRDSMSPPRTRVAEKPKTEPRDSMSQPKVKVAEKPKVDPTTTITKTPSAPIPSISKDPKGFTDRLKSMSNDDLARYSFGAEAKKRWDAARQSKTEPVQSPSSTGPKSQDRV